MKPRANFAGVTTITFDAAGTLLRPHPSVGAVYAEVAGRHGRTLAADVLERGFRAAFQQISKNPLVLDPEARERDFWRRVVLEAMRETGAPERFDLFFDELWETFAHGACWRVFAGTEETLRELRRRGFRLGVLSNWDRRLHRVLAETGLRAWFDAVIISSEAGAEKPDVGIFRTAERALAATPAQCLHIGDSRHHDLAGATAAGWRALLVRHETGAAEENEIEHLSDVLRLVPASAI